MNKHGLTMKELSIKEKAKAYDEALDRAKKWYNAPNIDKMPTYGNRIIEEIFPELIESEDEKIRKELIKFVKVNIPNEERYIAWLEKQNPIMAKSPQLGKQKSANNNELKFKVGDWVVENGVNGNPVQITSFEEDKGVGIKVWFSNGTGTWVDYLKGYHKFTIQDAKKGDILACDKCILIFDQLSESNNEQVLMDICHCTSKGFYWQDTKDRDLWVPDGFKPATKDQCNTLFAKMQEAGFEWDAEKKELKKIEERPAEWRQDNVEELTEFENAMMHIGGSFFGENAGLDPNDTDAIKEQANLLLELVPKQEWSEEDERVYRGLHNLIYSTPYCDSRKELSDWLKSIKQKIVTK